MIVSGWGKLVLCLSSRRSFHFSELLSINVDNAEKQEIEICEQKRRGREVAFIEYLQRTCQVLHVCIISFEALTYFNTVPPTITTAPYPIPTHTLLFPSVTPVFLPFLLPRKPRLQSPLGFFLCAGDSMPGTWQPVGLSALSRGK